MRQTHWLLNLAICGLAACAPRGRVAVTPDEALGRTTATYAGTIPCADCEGQRVVLTLFPDFTFRMRTTYLGLPSGQRPEAYDVGRWSRAGDGGSGLALSGDGETPSRFQFQTNDSLRMFDRSGNPIVSSLNYELKRQPAVDRVEGPMRVRGMYVYLADAASFTECRTAKRFPVLIEAGHLALEQAYLGARREPGEAMLVTFSGRFVERAPEPGLAMREYLRVERFERAWPGETCAATLQRTALVGGFPSN